MNVEGWGFAWGGSAIGDIAGKQGHFRQDEHCICKELERWISRTFKELQVKHQRITFEIRGSGCKEEYSLYFRQESEHERLSICFFSASFQSTFIVIINHIFLIHLNRAKAILEKNSEFPKLKVQKKNPKSNLIWQGKGVGVLLYQI